MIEASFERLATMTIRGITFTAIVSAAICTHALVACDNTSPANDPDASATDSDTDTDTDLAGSTLRGTLRGLRGLRGQALTLDT